MKAFKSALAALAIITATSVFAKDPEAVQIDVKDILNARVVSTVTDGKVNKLKIDIDGAGGHATQSAAELLDPKNPNPAKNAIALPNDGKFPANEKHPEVVLNYKDGDGDANQCRRVTGANEFSFAVPEKKYTQMWLWVTSGQGPSDIHMILTYKDGTTETHDIQVPDWFWELKKDAKNPREDDKNRCNLALDLSKFSKQGPVIQNELRHHSIHGVDAQPNPAKELVKVTVKKEKGGLMCFYGATGAVKE
jgi:hypothetical protein